MLMRLPICLLRTPDCGCVEVAAVTPKRSTVIRSERAWKKECGSLAEQEEDIFVAIFSPDLCPFPLLSHRGYASSASTEAVVEFELC